MIICASVIGRISGVGRTFAVDEDAIFTLSVHYEESIYYLIASDTEALRMLVDKIIIVQHIIGESLPLVVIQKLHGADSKILNIRLVRLSFKTNFVVNWNHLQSIR